MELKYITVNYSFECDQICEVQDPYVKLKIKVHSIGLDTNKMIDVFTHKWVIYKYGVVVLHEKPWNSCFWTDPGMWSFEIGILSIVASGPELYGILKNLIRWSWMADL